MKLGKFVSWVVAGSMLLALPVFAEDVDSTEEEVSKIDTMVVTAGRLEESIEDVTSNITVISEGDIKQSSAHDLGDLLQEQGFMIREYPNSVVVVDIRGFKTDIYDSDLEGYVLILIDGARSGTGQLNKINIDNVERVEIIRGPGSVQYGASAMGGVINVITKKGRGKPSVYVEQTMGSWDFEKTAVGGSGKIKSFDFSFSASTESQGDYSTAEGETYYNTGFDAKDRISANAGWTFMPGNRFGVTYTGYKAENVGNPGYFSSVDKTDKVHTSTNRKVDFNYQGRTGDGFWTWSLRYFNGENKRNSDTANEAPKDEQQGGQAQLTADWKPVRITAGMDWTYYEKANTYDNPAAFLLTKTKLSDDRLVISAAVRCDQYTMEDDEGKSTDDENWTPSVGAAFKITPEFKVRANYAEGFKVPTPEQLFRYNDYGFAILEGNPDLTPEKSKTYEFGLDFNKASINSSVTYFSTKFEDKIDYVNPTAGYWTYENLPGATISGIEGNLGFDIGSFFDWSVELAPYVSFTYLTEYKNDETDEDLYYNPEWKMSYGLRFAMRDLGFVSKLNFAYFSDQLIDDYQGTGQTELSGYTVADLTITKTLFSFEKYGDVSLKTDIRNIFNEDYQVVQGYPSPGRSFFVGLTYEY
ncbi:TonB-dependent receptor [uncultured Desulfosarcina sp.]|uniref:TonB-dependent receptor plug domain-containing protein n=1 Tax=uncultured Desulfosarcina sp. TaxID=218289 RepID=UPI0029C93D23|nr:TonB-dependent receptor [uncultured Desulfosarcina sp.]